MARELCIELKKLKKSISNSRSPRQKVVNRTSQKHFRTYLKLNLKKCHFGQSELDWLGFTINQVGIINVFTKLKGCPTCPTRHSPPLMPACTVNILEPIGSSLPKASSNVDPTVTVSVLSEHSLTCPVQAAPRPSFRWENMIGSGSSQ